MKKLTIIALLCAALLLAGCGGDDYAATALPSVNGGGSLEPVEPVGTADPGTAEKRILTQEEIKGLLLEKDYIDDAVVMVGDGEAGSVFSAIVSGDRLGENVDEILEVFTGNLGEIDLEMSIIMDTNMNILYPYE